MRQATPSTSATASSTPTRGVTRVSLADRPEGRGPQFRVRSFTGPVDRAREHLLQPSLECMGEV